MSTLNFCRAILDAARRHPERLALRIPRDSDGFRSSDSLTYGELLGRAASLQRALQRRGLQPGARVLLFARPSLELYAVLLALLGLGLVPVLLDRGMSRSRMLSAIAQSGARTLIGQREIVRRWWLLPQLWRFQRLALDGACFGVADLLRGQPACRWEDFQCVDLEDVAHGLISFTSGSTGQPKGADRTHASLIAQHHAIRAHWPDRDDDIDLPCFPVLVLHNLSCGIGTVLPAVDLAAPGQVDPALVLRQIASEGITRIAGAPAYAQRLVEHAESRQLTFPGVRSLVVGGSTLTEAVLRGCLRTFPNAHCRVVYGSTEAEPIADIDMPDLLRDWHQYPGHLVGTPADMAELCLVDPNRPLNDAASVLAARQPPLAIGEILVAGPHVLKAYVDNPQACAENKIPRADGLVWHRTGDCGFLDEQGRLWLSGRLKDAVRVDDRTLYSFALEKILDTLPGVRRSALLNAPTGEPLLVLEGRAEQPGELRATLRRFGLRQALLATVERMPVDGRHNSKIDRPALREALARRQLRGEPLL